MFGSSIYLLLLKGFTLAISNAWNYNENQYLILELQESLISGLNYTFQIGLFYGELVDDLAGLYRSSYTDENGEIV